MSERPTPFATTRGGPFFTQARARVSFSRRTPQSTRTFSFPCIRESTASISSRVITSWEGCTFGYENKNLEHRLCEGGGAPRWARDRVRSDLEPHGPSRTASRLDRESARRDSRPGGFDRRALKGRRRLPAAPRPALPRDPTAHAEPSLPPEGPLPRRPPHQRLPRGTHSGSAIDVRLGS